MDIENLPVAALFKFFEQYFPLNKEECKEGVARIIERNVKRPVFILQQDDIAKYFTLIISGWFRQYANDENGKDTIYDSPPK